MIYGQKGYDILDAREFERVQASHRLMDELERGKQSGEKRGWLTLDEVEERLGVQDGEVYKNLSPSP